MLKEIQSIVVKKMVHTLLYQGGGTNLLLLISHDELCSWANLNIQDLFHSKIPQFYTKIIIISDQSEKARRLKRSLRADFTMYVCINLPHKKSIYKSYHNKY